MRHALIIINPVAGKGKGLAVRDKLLNELDKAKITYDIIISSYEGEIEKIALDADIERITEIIVLGGDGTVVEAINGIINKKIRLGIIPIGTGNDFFRSIQPKIDIDDAIKKIVDEKIILSDVGKINDTYFLNVSGFGMDSYILENLKKIKKYIKGSIAYTVSTFYTLFSYRSKKVYIEIDGIQLERDIMLVSICNGKYFGGGMMISPNASIDDGQFELIIVKKMSILRFIKLFGKIFKGTHLFVDEVEEFKGKKFKIKSDVEIPINVDGNLIGVTPLEINVTNYKLEIFI
ncbi:MAG: diacylglycerol kinase family protein [Bacillota bacterium]|nr:diacylglycerol kinase family protein [Bacillota bacterium]